MDHKERYDDLLSTIKTLRTEIETLRAGNQPSDRIDKSLLFKAFHSTSQLMAISNFETGIYEDVNVAFLKSLGYNRDEIGRASCRERV